MAADNHIIRERIRRDDMSCKFATLESLLPWRSKARDRTAVVNDAIQFVLAMREKLNRLQQLQVDRFCSSIPPPQPPATINYPADEISSDITRAYDILNHDTNDLISHATKSKKHRIAQVKSGSRAACTTSNHFQIETNNKPISGELSNGNMISSWYDKSIIKVTVPTRHISDGIIIHISCSVKIPRFLIKVMTTIDQLGLHVLNLNYSTTSSELLCIIVAKIKSSFHSAANIIVSHIISSLNCSLGDYKEYLPPHN